MGGKKCLFYLPNYFKSGHVWAAIAIPWYGNIFAVIIPSEFNIELCLFGTYLQYSKKITCLKVAKSMEIFFSWQNSVYVTSGTYYIVVSLKVRQQMKTTTATTTLKHQTALPAQPNFTAEGRRLFRRLNSGAGVQCIPYINLWQRIYEPFGPLSMIITPLKHW